MLSMLVLPDSGRQHRRQGQYSYCVSKDGPSASHGGTRKRRRGQCDRLVSRPSLLTRGACTLPNPSLTSRRLTFLSKVMCVVHLMATRWRSDHSIRVREHCWHPREEEVGHQE